MSFRTAYVTSRPRGRRRREPVPPPAMAEHTPSEEPRQPAKITLAPIRLREITDLDVGLPNDPVAQRRAELEIRAAIARRQREGETIAALKRGAVTVILAEPAAVSEAV